MLSLALSRLGAFLGKKFYFPALMSDTAQDGYSDFYCFQEISDFSDFQSFP